MQTCENFPFTVCHFFGINAAYVKQGVKFK